MNFVWQFFFCISSTPCVTSNVILPPKQNSKSCMLHGIHQLVKRGIKFHHSYTNHGLYYNLHFNIKHSSSRKVKHLTAITKKAIRSLLWCWYPSAEALRTAKSKSFRLRIQNYHMAEIQWNSPYTTWSALPYNTG